MDAHSPHDAQRPADLDPSRSAPGSGFDPRDLVPEPLFCCDTDGRLVWLNGAAEHLTGRAAHELVGKGLGVLLPVEDRARVLRKLVRNHRRGQRDFYLEAPILTGDGRIHWVGVQVRRIRSANGREGYVASVHDLQAIHEELETLRRRVREVEACAHEANVAAQLKTEFLSTMSHEIRTPMNGLIGMSRLLMESRLEGEQQTWAEIINGSSRALLELVNDMLDYARIEAGRLEIESIPFDLRVAVDGVAAMLAPRANAKDRHFTCKVHHRVPSHVKGDPGRIRQVLTNVASWAIRTGDAGPIDVSVELAEETAHTVVVRFSICDTGMRAAGTPREELFDAFMRGDATMAERFGGAGLMLMLARKLVSLMGGEAGVRSDLGSGVTIWFMLPLAKQAQQPAPEPLADFDRSGLRVLIADPTRTVRTLLAEMLEGWGYSVQEVEDGLMALEKLRSAAEAGHPFAVALVDTGLPVLDSSSLAAALRDDPALSQTRLVLLANVGRRGDAAHAEELGFSAYLLKPVDPSQLHSALLEVLRRGRGADGTGIVTRHSLAEQERRRVRVLLVEDNPVNQLVAVAALRRVGYEPMVVANGQQAVRAAADEPFAIIFMDVMLPEGMSGIDATLAIRKHEAHVRHTPIIGVTAAASDDERRKCLEAGMDDFLPKPVDLEHMCGLVEQWTRHAVEAGISVREAAQQLNAQRGDWVSVIPAHEVARITDTPLSGSAQSPSASVAPAAPATPVTPAMPATPAAPPAPVAPAVAGDVHGEASPPDTAWRPDPIAVESAAAPEATHEPDAGSPPASEPGWTLTELSRVPVDPQAPEAVVAPPTDVPSAEPGRGPAWAPPEAPVAAVTPAEAALSLEPPAPVEVAASRPAPIAHELAPIEPENVAPLDHDAAQAQAGPAGPTEVQAPTVVRGQAADEAVSELPVRATDEVSLKPRTWEQAVSYGMVETPVLDRDRLAMSSMGNPELEAMLIRSFLEQAADRIDKLGTAIVSADPAQVEFEAHAMKGMCATLGALRCAEVFEHMERLAHEKRMDPLPFKLQRAQSEVERVEALLRDSTRRAA